MTEAQFIDYIARGAARLTASEVQRLVAIMPELREQFSSFRESAYPETEQQLWFLSHVVERVWTDSYRDLPYGAALEAAFAIAYFERDTDLIPDSLGPLGLTDDSAVVQTVLALNKSAFDKFSLETKLAWAEFPVSSAAP